MKRIFYLIAALLMPLAGYSQTAKEYYNSGIAKGNIQDFRGAISDFTKAIELDPRYEFAYYNRGISRGKLMNYTAAIADYTKVIELDPKFAYAYYVRGYVKIQIGQSDSGCLDLSKSRELGYSEANDAIKKYCNK